MSEQKAYFARKPRQSEVAGLRLPEGLRAAGYSRRRNAIGAEEQDAVDRRLEQHPGILRKAIKGLC